MSDSISRQAAIDALIEWYGCEPSDLDYFKEIVEKLPSADRPQGKWIDIGGYEVCKNCHEVKRFPHWTFCPNCGCRMKGADDE